MTGMKNEMQGMKRNGSFSYQSKQDELLGARPIEKTGLASSHRNIQDFISHKLP
jgi:hypothetical protein